MATQALYNLAVEDHSIDHSNRVGLLKDRTGIPLFLLFLSETEETLFLEFHSAEDVRTHRLQAKTAVDEHAWTCVEAFFEAKGRHLRVAAFPFNPEKKALPQMMGSAGSSRLATGIHVLNQFTENTDILAVPQAPSLLNQKEHALFYKALFSQTQQLEHFLVLVDLWKDFQAESVGELKGYASDDAAIYFPWVLMGEANVPPSALVAASIQQNDQKFGIQQTPANQPIDSRLEPLLALSPAQVALALEYHVNVVQRFPKRGLCLWGANTRSSDKEKGFIATRRTLLAVRQALHELCEPFVLEPTSTDLTRRIDVSLHSFFQSHSRLWDPNAKSPFFSHVELKQEGDAREVHVQVNLSLPYAIDKVSLSLELSDG